MQGTRLLAVLVAFGLIASAVPGGALAGTVAPGGQTAPESSDATNGGVGEATLTAQTDGTDASEGDKNTSRAPVGRQLATVIAVTDDEVDSDVEGSSLDTALEDANESERAEIVANRAATLRDRADEVVTDQRAARAAYEDGNVTREEFARRLATLAGQARTIDRGFGRLDDRTTDISALELRVAGYDRGTNEEARERLDRVMGSGTSALLAQYTGRQSGAFSLEVDGGISIEVESDGGERSRELEREQPGDGSFEVTQSEALAAATESLSTGLDGEWTLRSVDRDEDDGYYGFGFGFFGPGATGEAEVNVDGQTGEIFEFEEEIEPRDDGDAETPLSVSIANGTAAPDATVTLRVTAAGDPVEGATVELDDQDVGETDSDGRITVTLPDDDEVDIEVEAGEREGDLKITLRPDDDRDEDEKLREQLSASGSIDDGTVTVSVTYGGESVSDAAVYAADERVGTTDADGTVSFVAPEVADEVEITIIKGDFEAEFEFEVGSDGTLTLEDVDVDERDEEDVDEEDEEDADEEDVDEGDEEEADAGEDEEEGDVDEEEDEEEELAVTIVSDDPGPNTTTTLEVSDGDGAPVDGARVELDDQYAGETDSDGRIAVTFPDDDEVDVEVEAGEREGELEVELDDEEADDADEE